jgi:hypothetical protein
MARSHVDEMPSWIQVLARFFSQRITPPNTGSFS